MNNQELTNEERQALIDFINAEIARIQRKKELLEGDRMRIASHRLSLAALTAEPKEDERAQFESFMEWRFGDTLDRRRAKNGDRGYMAWSMAVAWEVWQRRAVPDFLSQPATGTIDHTAQQYEALAGWRMVPVEPTEEMLATYYDKSIAPISRLSVIGYRAMLEAAPKPEGKDG